MAKKAEGQSFGKFASFVLGHLADLSGSAVKVYSALCCRCGYHDRHVHISYPALMQTTGIGSEHTLCKSLNELESIGAITRKTGNVGKCNDYYLPLEPPAKSAGGMDSDPLQKVQGVTCKKCSAPTAKSAVRTKRSTEKSYKEARRAQPHGKAGGALRIAEGIEACSVCPSCGSPSAGDDSCPVCGWDYGQMPLPSSVEPQLCPECGLALQPDGTCWRHGRVG